MSSDADAAAAATIELYDTLYTSNYCIVAPAVVFIFDALITFDRDVACFWNTKWTGASLLFFANKWISITFYAMSLITFSSLRSDKSCSLFMPATYAISILQIVPGAVFSALRVFVLSRSKPIGFIVLALSLAPVGANLVKYGQHLSGGNFPPFGCLETDSISAALALRLVIISRVPLIAADTLLIYITWTKLSSWAALRDIRFSKRLSLSEILFHGGTMYFVVLFALNVLHLTFTATAVAGDGSSGNSIIPQFTSPITAILISRFLLALQEASQMTVRLDRDDPLHSSRNPWDSTPSFISSLGGFINPDLSTRSNDDGFEMELQIRSPPEAGEEEESRAQTESQAAASSSSA